MILNRTISIFIILSFMILLMVIACAPFRSSPFSDQLHRSERNLNQIALQRLSGLDNDGKIRIAVLADVHQNYKDLDQVIEEINQTPDIDFVVNLGDFTNSGYNLEYDQFMSSFADLKYSAFNVIGNHDAIGAGPELFFQAFGPSNFWFESESHRYVFFHSVHLEDPEGFDPEWLSQAIQTSEKPVFVFSHIHIKDKTRFGEEPIAQLFSDLAGNPKTKLLLSGHYHQYDLFQEPTGTLVIHCPRVEGEQWLLIEVTGSAISITRMDTEETAWAQLKN